MKVVRSQPALIALLVATALGVFGGSAVRAAVITWGPATTASADTDVSTAGTLVLALNIGETTSSPTVNGVVFTASSVGGLTGPGIGAYGGFGSATLPFSGLSSVYTNLLGSGAYNGGTDTMTLSLTGLISGNQYQFQWWANDARDLGTGLRTTTANDGNSNTVTLNNPANVVGQPGQFAIGTFLAGLSGTATITFQGSDGANMAAYQLRDLGVPLVPEPSTAWLMGVGALVLFRRRSARCGGQGRHRRNG